MSRAINHAEPLGKMSPDGSSFLPDHPSSIASSSWHRVTVAVIRDGQQRPYADSVLEAEVLFEGGTKSSVAGCDVPFFTRPKESRVREIVRALVGSFKDDGEAGAFDTRLARLELIEQGRSFSIWAVTLVTPYCD